MGGGHDIKWELPAGDALAQSASPSLSPPVVALTLMGVPIHDVTLAEAVVWVGRWLTRGGSYQIATVNPEFLMQARRDAAFRATLQGAALCVPDGIGVVWAARRRGKRLRERVAGVELTERLVAEAARCGWRVYFLGAAPGVAEQAAARLQERYPGLQVAGCYAGSPALAEEAALVARVREARPDLLFVAYGAPAQDLWLARNLARTGATVGMGVGGSLDFIAGITRRAPAWMRRLGLEWLHRLIRQPWRWRRQLVLPQFALLVLLRRDAPP